MNINFHDLIPKDFSDTSHVWIYQANRPFTIAETIRVEELLNDFSQNWLSHGALVKGYANILFGQFVIFMADESATGVSGCSTDSAVRLLKNIEKDHHISLFDRQILAFIINEKIQLIPLIQVNEFLEEKIINGNTLYFNNTILTKKELLNSWIIPVKQSWLANRITSLKMH